MPIPPSDLLTFNTPDLATLIKILIFFGIAVVVASFSHRFARRILAVSRYAPTQRKPSPERARTLEALIANSINALAFTLAFLFSLALFIPANTIIWVVGLFSAAFGLAARPMVSDFLAGISFMFNGGFDIGEKVEFILTGYNLQGVIEQVNLSTSVLRVPTSELVIVPNGEIRVVRNFSRGKCVPISLRIAVGEENQAQARAVLQAATEEAFLRLIYLCEPWKVLAPLQVDEVAVSAKAIAGKTAETRQAMMDLILSACRTKISACRSGRLYLINFPRAVAAHLIPLKNLGCPLPPFWQSLSTWLGDFS